MKPSFSGIIVGLIWVIAGGKYLLTGNLTAGTVLIVGGPIYAVLSGIRKYLYNKDAI